MGEQGPSSVISPLSLKHFNDQYNPYFRSLLIPVELHPHYKLLGSSLAPGKEAREVTMGREREMMVKRKEERVLTQREEKERDWA